jgi:hypothetical protein
MSGVASHQQHGFPFENTPDRYRQIAVVGNKVTERHEISKTDYSAAPAMPGS